MPELIPVYSCPNCGIGLDEDDEVCPQCGGEVWCEEFTPLELEEAILEGQSWEERNIRQMEECDGSWDY